MNKHVKAYLLPQRVLCILIAAVALFEFGDARFLLLGFLVVAFFFFDEPVEHGGCYRELGWGTHVAWSVLFCFCYCSFERREWHSLL
jgi:hypothetical protein